MSKSDAPLGEIDTGMAHADMIQPNWLDGSGITAFDFETADGDAFMLAVAEPERTRGSYVVEPSNTRETLDADGVLNTLASRRFAGGQICVWYNLAFDGDVFARALGREAATELYYNTQTTVDAPNGDGEIQIRYIPGKMLTFRHDSGEVVNHYDLANFARGGLEATVDEWLDVDDGKLTETVDADRFDDADYRADNWAEIREYAERDAELTRDAAQEVFRVAEAVGVPCGRPISSGSVAAAWLRANLDDKPNWGMTPAQELAWDSFAGGRFEVFERGHVGEVAGPDINSAYPAVMSQLPDPGSLAWEVTDSATLSDVRDAEYGFVRLTVTTDSDRRIQPFAMKPDGVVTYPACDGAEVTTLIDTFVHAVDAGIVEGFTIEKAALGHETEHTVYPFSFLTDVYDRRKELESNGQMKAGQMLKLVLNSLYGKTAQTTMKREILTEAVNPDEAAAEPHETFQSMDGVPLVESQAAGRLFNPFIASYITGLTRLELHKRVLEYGLEQDTIMFATDCVMVDADAFNSTDFMADLDGDQLGQWDFDYEGDAFVVGSGVYDVDVGEYMKMGTRGFREASVESIREAAEAAGDGPIPLETTRPTTLGEAMARGDSVDLADVGSFRQTERGLSPGFDRKRAWENDEPTWDDLLAGAEYGPPLVVEGGGG